MPTLVRLAWTRRGDVGHLDVSLSVYVHPEFVIGVDRYLHHPRGWVTRIHLIGGSAVECDLGPDKVMAVLFPGPEQGA